MTEPLSVFVVEDDPAVARLHLHFVQAHPDFVVAGVVHTGTDALAVAADLRPDLILLDFYLPDLSGLEVLQRLRQDPDLALTAVMALTAARDLDSIRRAHSAGVVHYLVKPFTAADLHARLDDVAGRLRHLRGMRRSAVDQRQVDEIFALQPHRAQSLPKGLGRPTLELIERTLTEIGGDASAQEVADRAGLSRVSARRYLEYLRLTGHADAAPRYGRAGRPELRYRAHAAAELDTD